jgi:hypothetical protein
MATLFSSPRLDAFLARHESNVAERLANGLVTQEKLDELHKSLDIDFSELCAFQELKTRAMLAGKLTQDEAQWVYARLGETTDTFNAQPLAVKVCITQMMSELLRMRL